MSNGRKFIIYSAYTWGVTMILLIIAIIMQFGNVTDNYNPGIGETSCWLKSKHIKCNFKVENKIKRFFIVQLQKNGNWS